MRAALWLGLYELLYLAHRRARRGRRGRRAGQAEPRAPSWSTRSCAGSQREGVELPGDDDPEGAAIRHSHPEWLVRMWWDWLGAEDTRALLAADNEPAEPALRVNTLVGRPGVVLPPGRRERRRAGPRRRRSTSWPARRGARARSWPSRAPRSAWRALVDPQPGRADPGPLRGARRQDHPPGRAHGRRGRGRGGRAPRRPRRGAADAPASGCARPASTVVQGRRRGLRGRRRRSTACCVDPPCSGLGTLRSHPDLRWRMTPEAIERAGRPIAGRAAGRRRAAPCAGRAARLLDVHDRAARGARRRARAPTARCPHRDATDGFYLAATAGAVADAARLARGSQGEPRAGVPALRGAVAAAHQPPRPLPLRVLPAPLRAALGLPGLRRALHDRAHVLDGDRGLQPLRRQSMLAEV